jgi:hypothetical protein
MKKEKEEKQRQFEKGGFTESAKKNVRKNSSS